VRSRFSRNTPSLREGREKLDGKRGKLALGFGSTEAYLGAEETI